MHAWVTDTFDAMVELARHPASLDPCATLDRIRVHFDAATHLFGRVYRHDVDGDSYRLRAGRHRTANKLRGLRAALTSERQTRHELGLTLQSWMDEARKLGAALESQNDAVRHWSEEARRLNVMLQEAHEAGARASGELARLRGALEHARRARQQADADLDAARLDLDSVRRDMVHAQARLDAMEVSTIWRMTRPLRWILARLPRLRQLGRRMFTQQPRS